MAGVKTTFITTVLNEQATIAGLLSSLLNQTKLPDEVIVVDGGSSDKTVEIAHSFQSAFKKASIKFSVLTRPGNRSIGRNEAIAHSHHDIILCADAGCILDDRWIEKISGPFAKKETDVVAGYYEGKATTSFQKALIPYVLVMEDKVDPNTFLPASRSMAFRKKVWSKVGGFPVSYSHNEDYVFANTIQKLGYRIEFVRDAIVYWLPRQTFRQAYTMFRRFAYGDAEAGIYRPKVAVLFMRYILALVIVWFALLTEQSIWLVTLGILLLLYYFWSVYKNYRYVRNFSAFYYLPLLQVTADCAVMVGTFRGMLSSIWDTWIMQE